MTDRGNIRAAKIERLFDGCRKLLVAELAAHADERYHGPGPSLPALPLGQPAPQPVVTLRPPALSSPLCQRRRSAQRAGLPVQHFEVVFQIEDLLQTAVAALVAGDPVAVVPELDRGGGDPRLDDRAGLQRHGVGVRPHLRASRLVDAREAYLGQV